MNKKFILALMIFGLVLGTVFLIRTGQNNYNSSDQISDNINATQQNSEKNSISLTEISKHNSMEDCWISYGGKVYDITSFLPKHPGTPEKILPYCGSANEFQNAFTQQHGTSKVKLLMSVGVLIGDFDVIGKTQN